MTELRIVRMVFTLGFFVAVVLVMVEPTRTWYYAAGALLFGVPTLWMWKGPLLAMTDAQANQQVYDRADTQRGTTAANEPGAIEPFTFGPGS
jgi:hypothetical protein